jgi:hypothetical protein
VAQAAAPAAWAQPSHANIHALGVRLHPKGGFVGFGMRLIAVAKSAEDDVEIDLSNDAGSELRRSIKQARAYVDHNASHPLARDVALRFAGVRGRVEGRSAGAAMTVLLMSLVEGFELDAKFAMTGAITEDGGVEMIGGVVAKILGAGKAGMNVVAVPADNVDAIADMFILDRSTDPLTEVQVFAVSHVDEAIAVARTDRDPDIQRAMATFSQVQSAIERRGLIALRRAAIRKKVDKTLELVPDHVSALYARRLANGKAPRTLTRTASVVEIFAASADFWQAVTSGQRVSRATMPNTMFAKAKRNLARLSTNLHPEVQPLRRAMITWVDTVHRAVRARRISRRDYAIIRQRAAAMDKQLKRLGTDRQLINKMLKEGY